MSRLQIDEQQITELNQQHRELLQRFHNGKTSNTMTIRFSDGFETDIFGRIDTSPEIADIFTDKPQSKRLWKLREAHGDFIWCRYGGNYIDLDKNLYIHVQRKWWQLWKR